jgi:hypothetical protein
MEVEIKWFILYTDICQSPSFVIVKDESVKVTVLQGSDARYVFQDCILYDFAFWPLFHIDVWPSGCILMLLKNMLAPSSGLTC